MKACLKKIAQKFGYDVMHLPTDPVVRQQIDFLVKYNINLVFDIGANVGQYGLRLREMGYSGQIVSFEPQPDAFQEVKLKADLDPNWTIVECAIGDYSGETQINISQNSYSSSILEVMPVHLKSAPESAYLHKVEVRITTVDALINRYYHPGTNLYIKVDTQGFERQVFEGCRQSIDKISGFQMELSLVPLYEGETLMQEMVNLLRDHGFKLVLIEGGHRNYETGELLQVEGYFYKV